VYVARAQDAWLEDVDGNRFLDLAGGIGCLNVGHRNQSVVSAVEGQLDNFLHTCVQVTPYESYVRLAERMNRITPGNFPKKTLCLNTGAEAVENAIKIARAHTGRSGVIAFEDAFHGRTMMALALTSKTHPYKAGFAPFPPEVYRIPYAYCYRCSYSLKYSSCDVYCARHLEDTFKRVVASEDVAAVIAEPVLGEGGFIAPPPHYGVEPDMVVTAKSLGGGLPLAAVTGRAEIMDAPGPGSLGGTFAGNPLSCAAAHAVLDVFEHGDLLTRANIIGSHFQRRAEDWQRRFEIIGDVRGLGAMRALELVKSRDSREPASDETKKITQYCYEHGLITIMAGTYGNVIRVLVPLVITDEQLDEALDVLESALKTISAARPAFAEVVSK
jgi:4-aminobutyrate aminotransferase/(S)-3-amino-2-methylpropionate transaminase